VRLLLRRLLLLATLEGTALLKGQTAGRAATAVGKATAATAPVWTVRQPTLQEDRTVAAAGEVAVEAAVLISGPTVLLLLRHPNGPAHDQRKGWPRRCDVQESSWNNSSAFCVELHEYVCSCCSSF